VLADHSSTEDERSVNIRYHYPDKVRRKLHAYHLFMQAGITAQGLL
jgi:hypothetical protein